MSIQQIRQSFASLQMTAVEYAQWSQGVVAAQTGQTPQPHWTDIQRGGYRAQAALQQALRKRVHHV